MLNGLLKRIKCHIRGCKQNLSVCFENCCPIAVTFVADGGDALRAVGHFIMNDEFIVEDENSIKKSCEDLGINDITVKKQ